MNKCYMSFLHGNLFLFFFFLTIQEPLTKGVAFLVHAKFQDSWLTDDGASQFVRWTCTHFEVVWDEELGRPEEVKDVAEHVSIPVNEVVLLQAVQDYGLRTIKETTNSTSKEGRGGGLGRKRGTEVSTEEPNVNVENLSSFCT